MVSDDCRLAKIYFSVMGSLEEREKSARGLDSAKGYIRKELGRRVGLRYTPEIIFLYDPSIEYAIHIGEVIQHLQQKGDKDGNENGD